MSAEAAGQSAQGTAPSRVVVVTGGSRGIGAAIVERLARSGAVVVAGDLAPGERSYAELGEGRAMWRRLDVTEERSCSELAEWVSGQWGGLDLLVNNAGVNFRQPLVSTALEDWRRVFATNVEGAYLMSRAFFPHLVRRQGSVVFVGSTCGVVGVPGSAAYCASKAALMHLARVLAVEWAGDGVRANCVAATAVPTAMTADVLDNEDYVTAKLARIPLRRFPSAADVASAVEFLSSVEARNITGQTLFVDGGFTAS